MSLLLLSYFLFFFNDTATTEIYTLSLHDALPIFSILWEVFTTGKQVPGYPSLVVGLMTIGGVQLIMIGIVGEYIGKILSELKARPRSEEHTSELQSHVNLVCRLLLEKKKKRTHEN